jgi:tetratricopeptide (TPR) repeat protein
MTLCLRTLGHAARRACDPWLAVQLFEQALALPQPGGAGNLQAVMLDALGMALIQCGETSRALELVHRALLLNQAAGDEVQRMYNHYNLSQCHAIAGQPEQALPWARAGLVIGMQCGFPLFLPYLHAELARVLVDLGRTDEAQAEVNLAQARAHDTGDAAASASALAAQARVALRLGDLAAARQATRAAVRAGLATGNRAIGGMLLPLAQQAWAGHPRAPAWSRLPAIEWLPAMGADLDRDLDVDLGAAD